MNPQVLVVGAGPVGLTMAAQLSLHGLSVRIIDKNKERTSLSKALAMWPRTLELMEQLDLADTLIQAGTRCHGANMWAEGKKILHATLDYMESHFKFGLLIPQSETERILEEFLATRFGLKVERETEMIAFQQDAQECRVQLRHADGREEAVVTPWLCGCDGSHSLTRKTLGLEFAGKTSQTDWILADVAVTEPVWPEDEISAFMEGGGVMAVFPFGGTSGRRFRLICDVGDRPPDAQARGTDPTLAEFQALVDKRVPYKVTLTDPHWLACFCINERKVSDYRRGRVFLAGDAAHVHSPFGGQGMNTGMQDACNLAWKLAEVTHGRAQATILDTYSPERSAVGDAVLKNAGRMTTIATLRNPVAQAIRNRVYEFLGNLELVQRKANQVLGELDIHYPNSALSQEHGGSHAWLLGSGVHAGDRLPDGELTAPDGSTLRLHSLILDTRWDLLLLEGLDGKCELDLLGLGARLTAQYPNVACHVIGRGGLGDPQGVVRKALGAAHSAAYLVRPDGYVGFRGQPIQEEALLNYLKTFLIPVAQPVA